MAASPNRKEGQSSTRPPRLNGHFYSWWKVKIHDFLMAEDSELWDIVLNGPFIPMIEEKDGEKTRLVPKPRQKYDEADRKNIEKGYKVKTLLVCGIGPDEFNRVSACESAKEIWDCLKITHEGTEQSLAAWGDSSSDSEDPDEPNDVSMVVVHEEETIFNEMFAFMAYLENEEEEDKRTLAKVMIDSVIELTYERDIMNAELDSLTENKDKIEEKMLKMEDKMASLESDKTELKNQLYQINEEAEKQNGRSNGLQVAIKEKLKTSKTYHGLALEKSNNLEKDIVKLKEELEKYLKWTKSSKLLSSVTNQSNFSKKGLGSFNITPPFNPHSKYVFVSDNLLCLHCGKNGHLKEECIAWRKSHERLSKYTEKQRVSERSSSQCWYMDSGCSILVILLSVSQISDKGNEVKFTSEKCTVANLTTKKVILIAFRSKNMYVANLETSNGDDLTCLSAQNENVDLWPRRLGHVSSSLLMNKLISKDMVLGLPKLKFCENKIYEACVKEKQISSSFKSKKQVTSSRVLELLHMDLCGPLKVQCRNGKIYIMVIDDDYSRFDHGTEFENSKLDQFFMENGISHNFSAPRTPQQNGVVERKNRTLVNIARTMIIESNLPQGFRAEAVNTACHVTNRCLIRSLLNKTPYELLNHRKPMLSYLRAFGCKCFVLNNGKDDLGKFDPRNDEGVLKSDASNDEDELIKRFNSQKIEGSEAGANDQLRNDNDNENHSLSEKTDEGEKCDEGPSTTQNSSQNISNSPEMMSSLKKKNMLIS
ncbi:uncharacterized protein LOC107019547 [Solanum pennellii]|uniref:Uncharacterized protein LOC107019547 n=1 Tax=Solanum pennellii TaxID=28526 RepID=A0ABM1GSX1_SOLPN|nr:uncharacterized protein LOC107019547 [Solanum pennellii]